MLGLLLAAFELTVGLLILAGGRKTTLGLLGALAFHLGLMLFGWGFWFWSVPVLAVLVARYITISASHEAVRGSVIQTDRAISVPFPARCLRFATVYHGTPDRLTSAPST